MPLLGDVLHSVLKLAALLVLKVAFQVFIAICFILSCFRQAQFADELSFLVSLFVAFFQEFDETLLFFGLQEGLEALVFRHEQLAQLFGALSCRYQWRLATLDVAQRASLGVLNEVLTCGWLGEAERFWHPLVGKISLIT